VAILTDSYWQPFYFGPVIALTWTNERTSHCSPSCLAIETDKRQLWDEISTL